MAINYYANIKMVGSDVEMDRNELLLPVIDNETSAPATGNEVKGQMYFDTTSNIMYFYNGAAWVEMDGTGSGVEKISATNGTFVEFNSGTDLSNATGDVDFGTFDLAATGTPSATTFLRGDNEWATPSGSYTSWTLGATTGTDNEILDGDDVDFVGTTGISTSVATAGAKSTITINNTGVTSIVAGTNISVSSATGAVTVSSTDTNTTSLGIANDAGTEQFKVTDTVDLEFAAAGGASVAFDNTNKRVTYTAPSNTNETYTLPVAAGAANSAILNLTAGGSGSGVKSAVTINGTTNQIAISETAGNNGQVTVGLPSSVTIGGTFTSNVLDITTTATIGTDVTIGGDIDLTGQLDMNGSKVVSLGNATLSSDAINLGQVQGLIAGVGLFKGGYNATTGLTTDLGAGGNGSLDGASNIALDLGDFFVVTTGGTAFYTTTLEIGDTIYANQNITASSTPAESVYTVVIQDQNVAGAGASDAATQKGVAGFDSATFSVTSNGFVTSDVYAGTTTKGVVPTGGSAITFLRGDGTFVTPDNDNTQRAAGTGLSLSGNTINANVNATVQTEAKEAVSVTADRTYELQVDSSDQLVVNVPWSEGSDTGVTSVSLALGVSTGAPLDATIVSRALNLTSKSYAGGSKEGFVPLGGDSATFLRGDGTWATPTDTNIVTSVSASTAADLDGMSVTPTTGAVVVGLDIASLGAVTSLENDADFIAVHTDEVGNKKITVENLLQQHTFKSGTISAYGAITHSLGSFDVMVQIYDEDTKDTIHMEVERNSVNQVTIGGTGTFPSSGVIVLVSKMG